ncbi:MAG: hypothetical protein LBL75_02865 [Rickettsiales bacterium]|nr:hypothetical protein [Rickettsiales bacterium]
MIKDSIIIILLTLFWAAVSIFGNYIRATGLVLAIVAVVWIFFDLFIWRWFSPIIIRQYNISGKWKGKLHYNYKGKKGQKAVNVEIKQTFSSTKVIILSDEMHGESIVSKWFYDENKLFYVYRTDPKSEHKDKNPVQYGGAQIKVDNKNLNKIRIEYWTDRQTKGYMELKKC